jgi:1-acyl-sn-glycerol-3-phosphate acyltransferase
MMNYWSKGVFEVPWPLNSIQNPSFFLLFFLLASLFANSIASWVLYSSGNIPVDRKSKDRQKLFKGTIEALAQGKAVALFPEGTSYTEPRIMQVKDGAAWAAREYAKWAKENPERVSSQKDVLIVPVSIVYTNKSKYRSAVSYYCVVRVFPSNSVF